jgi:hypothetical protein
LKRVVRRQEQRMKEAHKDRLRQKTAEKVRGARVARYACTCDDARRQGMLVGCRHERLNGHTHEASSSNMSKHETSKMLRRACGVELAACIGYRQCVRTHPASLYAHIRIPLRIHIPIHIPPAPYHMHTYTSRTHIPIRAHVRHCRTCRARRSCRA